MSNKKEPTTEEQKDQAFWDAIKKVCNQHRRGIMATPALRFNPTSNGFDIIVNLDVSRMDPE